MEKQSVVFELPLKLPTLNEYVLACRSHWSKGHKAKSAIEEEIMYFLRVGKIKIDEPVFIHFEWHEKTRKRDKDNVASGKKFILDALQKKGILPNDNNQYILGFSDKFVYGKEDKVIVTIEKGA